MKKRFLLTLAMLLVSSQLVQAATITLYNRATFQIAVSGNLVTEQDFDSFAPGSFLTVDGAGVTYAASGGSPVVTNAYGTTTPSNGLGSIPYEFFRGDLEETVTFTFPTTISAFAIDINTYDQSEGGYTGTLGIGDTILSVFDPFFTGAGLQGQFLGFISDTPFSSVTIGANNGFNYTLDTLVYGDARAIPTPEPATLFLMLAGIVGLSGTKLRKKKYSY